MLSSIDLLHSNTGLTLNLALSYSSRLEILQAVKNVVAAVKTGDLDLEELDEQKFSNFLYTKTMPDPDLVIRTSGEQRISNFLLWQIAYAEIFVSDTLWPEFRRLKFLEAIDAFQHRERRFGGVITKST
jgi:undecaprenyl diphosphate synthase